MGGGRFEEALARAREAGAAAGRQIGVVEVADEREALALLGRNASGRPDLEMRITGITGTNGKTTTAWLVAAMFEADGIPCGVMGTVEHRFGDMREEAARTTPEGPEIHATLRRMRTAGAGACAMEVSSHALVQARVDGLRFRAAVYTNLTGERVVLRSVAGVGGRCEQTTGSVSESVIPDGGLAEVLEDCWCCAPAGETCTPGTRSGLGRAYLAQCFK